VNCNAAGSRSDNGRICSLENETGCIHVVYSMYLFVERCVLLVYQMYTFRVRKTYVTMSTQCVHGVQRINAVKGVDIRVQSYSNEIQ